MALLTPRAAIVAVALAACTAGRAVPAAGQAPLEYEVKAAYLLNFTRFVEWPADAFGDAAAPIRVCVASRDPFGGALQRILGGERAGTHPFEVSHLTDEGAGAGCHVLFIPRTPAGTLARWLSAASGAVLIVGEQPELLPAGGVVNFVLENGHVRFDVNPAAAADRGLRVSSKLLRVAHQIVDATRRPGRP